MRAAEAAQNTAGMIEGMVVKVKKGNELVEQTVAKFRQVADSVGKSGELIGEISAASQERAQGIEQVNKAVGEMDKVIAQNAANAEESASASELWKAGKLSPPRNNGDRNGSTQVRLRTYYDMKT